MMVPSVKSDSRGAVFELVVKEGIFSYSTVQAEVEHFFNSLGDSIYSRLESIISIAYMVLSRAIDSLWLYACHICHEPPISVV